MTDHRFSRLYKFKPIDCYLDKMFNDNEIFFSGRLLLNDPNESILRFAWQQGFSRDGRREIEIFPLKPPVFSSVSNFYFFCMTKYANSIPMWGHYGDSHRGVCIEFNFDMAVQQWKSQPEKPWKIESDSGTVFIDEVRYQDELDEFILAPDGSPNLTPDQTDNFGFHKMNCWRGEDEVRMRLSGTSDSTDEAPPKGIAWRFDKRSLTGVYFGIRTEKDEKERLWDLVTSSGYTCNFFEGCDIAKERDTFVVKFRKYERRCIDELRSIDD